MWMYKVLQEVTRERMTEPSPLSLVVCEAIKHTAAHFTSDRPGRVLVLREKNLTVRGIFGYNRRRRLERVSLTRYWTVQITSLITDRFIATDDAVLHEVATVHDQGKAVGGC